MNFEYVMLCSRVAALIRVTLYLHQEIHEQLPFSGPATAKNGFACFTSFIRFEDQNCAASWWRLVTAPALVPHDVRPEERALRADLRELVGRLVSAIHALMDCK